VADAKGFPFGMGNGVMDCMPREREYLFGHETHRGGLSVSGTTGRIPPHTEWLIPPTSRALHGALGRPETVKRPAFDDIPEKNTRGISLCIHSSAGYSVLSRTPNPTPPRHSSPPPLAAQSSPPRLPVHRSYPIPTISSTAWKHEFTSWLQPT
jgi:hypothetical protein